MLTDWYLKFGKFGKWRVGFISHYIVARSCDHNFLFVPHCLLLFCLVMVDAPILCANNECCPKMCNAWGLSVIKQGFIQTFTLLHSIWHLQVVCRCDLNNKMKMLYAYNACIQGNKMSNIPQMNVMTWFEAEEIHKWGIHKNIWSFLTKLSNMIENMLIEIIHILVLAISTIKKVLYIHGMKLQPLLQWFRD